MTVAQQNIEKQVHKGRVAGTPNKPKRLLIQKLQASYGKEFDAVMEMAKNAVVIQGIATSLAIAFNEIDVKADDFDIEQYVSKMGKTLSTANEAIFAWDRVAQYVQPKLKAMEVTGEMHLLLRKKEVRRFDGSLEPIDIEGESELIEQHG